MGARAQVSIQCNEKDPAVYIYTHWGTESLKEDVQTALAKKWRWNDYEYLTRIIYDTVVGTEAGTETGYGIGTEEHGDIELLVQILPGQKVKIGGISWTFEEYLKQTFE